MLGKGEGRGEGGQQWNASVQALQHYSQNKVRRLRRLRVRTEQGAQHEK